MPHSGLSDNRRRVRLNFTMAIKEKTRRCSVYLLPEEDGGFSAIATDLPGVASQGETEEEALANIQEAYESAIRIYEQDRESVPWLSTPEKPEPGSILRSVLVHG